MSKIVNYVKDHAKAFGAAIVAVATYLYGVMPAEGGLGDVTTLQWLGAIVFVGGAFGITAGIRNRQPEVLVRLNKQGHLIAGDGADKPTGERLSPYTVLHEITPTD
jgi:hypothetical protein